MKSAIEVHGSCRFSTEHAAQDDCFVHVFEHEGREIHIGALSDGCTGSGDFHYQPELGAHWLVREFAKQAETVYVQGLRGESLGRKTALNVLAGMRDYRPQYQRSKWVRGSCGGYCNELPATLYGVVADEESLALITSGDGVELRNSDWRFNPYDGTYPCHILTAHPEQQWDEKLDEYFKISSRPIDAINVFAIASDGFKRIQKTAIRRVVAQWDDDPERLVQELLDMPEIPENHDDITVVALAGSRS